MATAVVRSKQLSVGHEERLARSAVLKSRAAHGRLVLMLFCASLFLPGPLMIGDSGVSLAFVLLPVIMGATARAGVEQMSRHVDRSYIALILCLLGALSTWSLLSGFAAEEFIRIGRPIIGYLTGVIVLLGVLAAFPSAKDAYRMATWLVSVAGFVGILAALGSRIPGAGDLILTIGDRSAGFFKHPNQLGIVMGMFLPLGVAMAASRNYRSPLSLVALLGLVVGLLASGSKTNIMIAGAAVIVVSAIVPSLRRGVASAGAVALNGAFVGALGAFLYLIWDALNPRSLVTLQSVLSSEGGIWAYRTVDSRQRLWDESFRLLAENPFLGVGAGQPFPPGFGSHPHSHNAIIDALRTIGVPGGFLMLLFVVLIIGLCIRTTLGTIRVSRARSADQLTYHAAVIGSAGGCFTYIAANQMSDSFGPSTFSLFFAVLGMMLALRQTEGHRHIVSHPRQISPTRWSN